MCLHKNRLIQVCLQHEKKQYEILQVEGRKCIPFRVQGTWTLRDRPEVQILLFGSLFILYTLISSIKVV